MHKMKTTFITSFTAHRLLWKSHIGFLFFFYNNPWWPRPGSTKHRCLSPLPPASPAKPSPAPLGDQGLVCRHPISGWSKNGRLFISSTSTVLIRACQPQEFCSPARNRPSLPSCPQWASEAPLASGASVAVAGAALQNPGSFDKGTSLGSFEIGLSVTSGGVLITCLLFNVLKRGFFFLFYFWFKSLARALALRANHKDAETHGWLLTRKCKGFM